jgi:Tfp pilus assembly protein PilO
MEWVATLIAVMIMPLGMIFWWIPRCDAIGVRKAKQRTAHETLTTNPHRSSPSQHSVKLARERDQAPA